MGPSAILSPLAGLTRARRSGSRGLRPWLLTIAAPRLDITLRFFCSPLAWWDWPPANDGRERNSLSLHVSMVRFPLHCCWPCLPATPRRDGADNENGRDAGPPVVVPDDAIIRPYDPQPDGGLYGADRLLVPYGALRRAVEPGASGQEVGQPCPPRALRLGRRVVPHDPRGRRLLLLSGRLNIDVYADGFVQIPLGLRGGVLGPGGARRQAGAAAAGRLPDPRRGKGRGRGRHRG